jgi:Skp family chaperone for outer membrane proteins|tara:strand:+ start:668 stop:1111 length:444 start_codon:yes stop_codon:yes gene_type:complete
MIINVVDFEKLTTVYKPYLDGVKEINTKRDEFVTKLEPIRKEMQEIIKSLTSKVETPGEDKQANEIKYNELQENAITLDEEFKGLAKEMKDSLNAKTFDELSIMIDEFIEGKEIDLVIGKMEVVFVKPNFEITDNIVELLRSKQLAD